MDSNLFQSNGALDLDSFNILFKEYQHRFIRFAMSYIGDITASEDIVMESFSAAWSRREQLSCASFPAYTLTCVKNRCLNHLRDQALHLRTTEQLYIHGQRMINNSISTLEACDPQELFSEETRQLIDNALKKLPNKTREIFMRSRFQGQTYKQIAQEMDTSVKSVEFEVSKAMKLMRIELKDYLAIFIFWFLFTL